MSADGTIIAGYGGTKTGNKAFVTTFLGVDEATGEAILESYVLPAIDGGKWSEAYAMTPDGLLHRRPQRQPQGTPGLHLVPGR